MPLGTATTRNNAGPFEAFFEGWLVRQEQNLDELRHAHQNCDGDCREDDLKELIARVLSLTTRRNPEPPTANRNVFLVFSPTWFTPSDRTFFWIAGFKPGLSFWIVTNSVDGLTEDQNQRIRQLRYQTSAEEKEVAEQLASIQESVAAPPKMVLARREGRGLKDGEIREVDVVLEALGSSMESVLGRADMLRTRTAEKGVEILNPVQNVKFLTAATQLQLRIRMCGLQRADRESENKLMGCRI